jgi:hypothetical protein
MRVMRAKRGVRTNGDAAKRVILGQTSGAAGRIRLGLANGPARLWCCGAKRVVRPNGDAARLVMRAMRAKRAMRVMRVMRLMRMQLVLQANLG